MLSKSALTVRLSYSSKPEPKVTCTPDDGRFTLPSAGGTVTFVPDAKTESFDFDTRPDTRHLTFYDADATSLQAPTRDAGFAPLVVEEVTAKALMAVSRGSDEDFGYCVTILTPAGPMVAGPMIVNRPGNGA